MVLSVFLSAFSFVYVYAEKDILLIDTEASCITSSCHADMGKKKYVHAIGVDGKQCKRCHEIVKQGEHSFKKLLSETYPLCAKCHSEEFTTPPDIKGTPPKVIFKDKEIKLHKPFAEGKCTECHNAHESNFYKHLKAEYPSEFYASYSQETYSLCIKCHKELEKALTEPRTLTDTKFRNGNLNLHFRHVNKEKSRTCRVCHQHHGSKNPKLIRKDFLFEKRTLTIEYEKTETGGICITPCHIPVRYDRYKPVEIFMKTTPRLGEDATPEELKLSREREMKELKTELGKSENK
jgi:predicted CXXCH cytochrome family protein